MSAVYIPERLDNFQLYDPNRKQVINDLSDNTSQWLMAPEVKAKIIDSFNDENVYLTRYPDIYATALKESLANFYSTSSDKFVIGCGTDDILDSTLRALTNENDAIAICTPTFMMAKYFAQVNGRNVVETKLSVDGQIDIGRLLDMNPRLVYLCTPNNPTGLSIEKDSIEQLAENFDGIIIIDEAYYDYSTQDCFDLIDKYENIIITRTFSKLYALAGLRIGYAFGDKRLINAIEAVKGPYKANTIAQIAAIESLKYIEYYNQVVKETLDEKSFLINQLISIGYSPIISDSNFIFIPLETTNDIKTSFEKENIAIRVFENIDTYKQGVRITVSKREINETVIEVLKSVKNG